jgi:hypothetical protein
VDLQIRRASLQPGADVKTAGLYGWSRMSYGITN